MNNEDFFNEINDPTKAITTGKGATAGSRSLKKFPQLIEKLNELYPGISISTQLYLAKNRMLSAPILNCGHSAKFKTYAEGYMDVCVEGATKCNAVKEANQFKQKEIDIPAYQSFNAVLTEPKSLQQLKDLTIAAIEGASSKQRYYRIYNNPTLKAIFEMAYKGLPCGEISADTIYLAINGLGEPPKAKCGNIAEWIDFENGFRTDKCILGNKYCSVCAGLKSKKQSEYRSENTTGNIDSPENKATMFANHGTTNLNDEKFNTKRKETSLSKYGTEHPMQSDILKAQVVQTCQEKYQVDNVMQVKQIQELNYQNNLDNHDGVYSTTTDEVKQKSVQTNIKKYGAEHHFKIQENIDARQSTNMLNHGAKEYLARADIKEERKLKHAKLKYERFNNTGFKTNFSHTDLLLNLDSYSFTCKTCNNTFDYKLTEYYNKPVCNVCNPKKISKPEQELRDYLLLIAPNTRHVYGDKSILKNNREIDIYLPEYKVAFEINGLYWHSPDNKRSSSIKYTPTYHQDKVIQCKEKEIFLMSIFTDDWEHKREKIKLRIQSAIGMNSRIYARDCTIEEIDFNEARNFNNYNHMQNYANGEKYRFGLKFNNELVALMTFSANATYEYEIKRYCSTGTIIGGCSKLFTHFLRTVNPSTVLSYADLEYGHGDVYKMLGFVFDGYTKPSYSYVANGSNKREPRTNYMKKDLHKKLSIFDASKTELENMIANGYIRVFGCGSARYIWRKS